MSIVDVRRKPLKKGEANYAIFWERSANSGVILRTATSMGEACKNNYSPAFVKHTVVKIVGEPTEYGEAH